MEGHGSIEVDALGYVWWGYAYAVIVVANVVEKYEALVL
jgi:hypothetical protein